MPPVRALGRRRGQPNRSHSQWRLTQRALLVLVAIGVSVFMVGLILGSHLIFSASAPESLTEGNPKSANNHKGVHDLMLASAAIEAAAKKAQSAVAALKHKVALPRRFKRDGANAADAGDHHHVPKTIMKALHPDHELIMKDYARKAAASDNETSKDLQQRLEEHKKNLRGPFTNMVDKINHAVQEVEHAVMDNKGPFPYFGTPVSETHDFSTYKPLGADRFAEWKDGSTPYAITDEIRKQSDDLARTRRVHVKNAMKHAWKGYKAHAFGQDEVLPISGRGHNNWGGMGTTLVDSLDTLWLMGLKEEFWEGRDWVRDHLEHDHVNSVSVFETTIRSLGGLLSAYDWSGDKVFLEKAQDLGKRLVRAFDSPSGIPYGQVSLSHPESHNNLGWAGGNAILSEAGTLQVEFRYLARATGITEYATKSERVFEVMEPLQSKNNGLFPYYIKNKNKEVKFGNAKITFGAMGDSIYEYMLKIWLQGGKTEPLYRTMYDNAMQGMHEMLLQYSKPSNLAYIADQNSGNLDHKMDHLVCFMGGSLVLGAYTDPLGLDSERAQRDLKVGKQLAYTCYQMYARTKTGISPEVVRFGEHDFSTDHGAPFYILRPETVETFFILNQLTGDPIYREWGWEVFQSIERFCKTKIAYGSLHDVNNDGQGPEDRMESFFLAETMKYLYLLQDPDTEIDILHKHVFNTEAHPVRIFSEMDKAQTV